MTPKQFNAFMVKIDIIIGMMFIGILALGGIVGLFIFK